MKLLHPATLFFSALLFSSFAVFPQGAQVTGADTSVIIHKTDGYATEWPSSKLVADSTNNVSYAIDNDRQNLYVVLQTGNTGMQMKILRMGMKLFIDLKEKKKESRGIEFPVKGETNGYQPDNTTTQTSGGKMDMNRMRAVYKINDISMKLFGFEGQPPEQGLMMANSAEIAFNWDSNNTLSIEYIIPLKIFHEDMSSLDKKEINVGWKINGFERSASFNNENESSGNSEGEGTHNRGNGSWSGRGGGGGYRGNRGNGGSNNGGSFDREKFSQEQILWTKFQFSF